MIDENAATTVTEIDCEEKRPTRKDSLFIDVTHNNRSCVSM